MIGSNQIHFCQAQMMDAIDTYLREHVFQNGTFRVKSVKAIGGGFSDTFVIELTDEINP